MVVNIKDKNLVGAAGEHLVLSRLLSKGILAAQAPRGARKADILVNHLDGKPPCLIQVNPHLVFHIPVKLHLQIREIDGVSST